MYSYVFMKIKFFGIYLIKNAQEIPFGSVPSSRNCLITPTVSLMLLWFHPGRLTNAFRKFRFSEIEKH